MIKHKQNHWLSKYLIAWLISYFLNKLAARILSIPNSSLIYLTSFWLTVRTYLLAVIDDNYVATFFELS